MAEPAAVNAAYYRRLLRGATRWFVWGAIIGILLGALFQQVATPAYAATVTVRLTTSAPSSPVDVVSEAAAAKDPVVLRNASQKLNGDLNTDELARDVDATGIDGSALVDIKATADSAHRAIDVARAVAVAFLDYRATTAADTRSRALNVIRDQIAELQRNGGGSGSADEIIALRQERASLLLVDPSPGDVVSVPQPDSVAGPMATRLILVAGALAGGMAGLVLCVCHNLFSRRLRDRTDVVAVWSGLPAVDVAAGDREAGAERATRELRTLTSPRTTRPQDGSWPKTSLTVNLASRRARPLAEQMARAAIGSHPQGQVLELGEHRDKPKVPQRRQRALDKEGATDGSSTEDRTPRHELVPCLIGDDLRRRLTDTRQGPTALVLPETAAHADIAEVMDLVDTAYLVVGPRTTKRELRSVLEIADRLQVDQVGVLFSRKGRRHS